MRSRSSSAVPLPLLVLTLAAAPACGDDGENAASGGAVGAATGSPSASASGSGGAASTGSGTGAGATNSSSSASVAAGGAGGGADGDAPTRTVSFEPSEATIPNPERGFYSSIDLLEDDDLSWVTARGHTLVHSYVRLDDHRNGPLPVSLLDAVEDGMTILRSAGLKIVLRFSYNFGPYPNSEPDAPLARVLEHVEQLAPILDRNQDVIAVLQAGFIGAWGEWHTSTNDLDQPATRATILDALLDALPPSRAVVLRYPAHKEAIFGAPIDESTAWSGSEAARTGHHNDCFLSSPTDVGTYPSDEVELWKDYLQSDTAFVPMGGETCATFPPRSECASALAEMERLHFTFLNQDYHPEVLESWVEGGCKDEMDRRLGYRLVLVSADLPEAIRPGGSFSLRLRIRNEGFAAPINPRGLRLVLEAGGQRFEAALPGADARQLLAGEVVELAARLRLPASIPEGPAHLFLGLPDPDLQGDPRQAIQLANEGLWDADTGENRLGTLSITADAPGTANPSATDLVAEPLP